MTNSVNSLQTNLISPAKGAVGKDVGTANGSSFADSLKGYLDEVNQMQQDASKQVQQLVTGQTDDLAGVMSAMEKSDVAFKSLMAMRQKLLTAYEELRSMPI
jgi:flagellar hook-basal body complex protein FliE